MIGETKTTFLHGYEVTLSQHPDGEPMCDVSTTTSNVTYTGSLSRLESIDGCLEADVAGDLWRPSKRAVAVIGDWARANGY